MLSSILKLVPFAVLFGVFLYMGISGMNGVQFFDRLILFLMPTKHHPQVHSLEIRSIDGAAT
jgi:solute carrier family 4 anion exchanger 2